MKRLPSLIIGLLTIVALFFLFWTFLSAPTEYDLRKTRNSAESLLGSNKEAAYSILKAYDSGYSPYQIVQSIYAKRINKPSGTEDEAPERAKQNSLILNKSDFLSLFNDVSDDGSNWLTWMLGAIANGYRVDQITEYMQRRTSTGAEPEDIFGVPVIMVDGQFVVPELPFDWPFTSRNTLASVIEGDRTLAGDMVEVYIIGLVNAGYSSPQIEEALKNNSVGISSTKRGNSDPSELTPSYIDDGKIIKPEITTERQPKHSQIGDESPAWATRINRTVKRKIANKKEIGKYELIPTISRTLPKNEREITKHDVTLELKPHQSKLNPNSRIAYYEVHAAVDMQVTQISDASSFGDRASKGDRWVIKGYVFPIEEEDYTNHDHLLAIDNSGVGEFNGKNATGLFVESSYLANGDLKSQRVFTGSISGNVDKELTELENGGMLEIYDLLVKPDRFY